MLASCASLDCIQSRAAEEWAAEALLLYSSGSPRINDIRARSTGNERLRIYAQALARLFREPLREENALLARKSFDTLFEVNPNDDVGIASAYYLARIFHRHLDEPDLDAAREAYRYLFESYPKRYFGELAFLKYVLLELYNSDGSMPRSDQLKRLEAMGQELMIPDMRRGFHRSIGQAYRVFEVSDAKALEHLTAACDIETSVPETQTDLLLDVAELAETLGKPDAATKALQMFLEIAPRDARKTDVAVRLAALKRKQIE